jgi:competence protein ComEC
MPITIAFFLGILSIQIAPSLPSAPWLVALILVLIGLIRWRQWVMLAFAVGVTWAWGHGVWQQQSFLPQGLEGQDILVEGHIVSLPVRLAKGWRFEFDIDHLAGQSLSFAGKTRLYWYRHAPDLRLGQHWQLQVRLKRPRGFLNPGGFDYEGWLWQANIRATGYVRKSKNNNLLDEARGTHLLGKMRQSIQDGLQQVPDSGRPLISALSIGDRSGFNQEDWSHFRATGSNHLVAISGLHIGMVAGALLLGKPLDQNNRGIRSQVFGSD